ncbi:hypothetical protein AAFF_G00095090 [Aldrovandia affinis]|uniref:BTB domain-containing protein n=1 Tax=Aldrovandia affinis TaxID=143900 RepID=A0AAD7WBQ9_9TELE|nr:hypothetical protein AAFF_G00095090 [Aldrovandia affinis]
MGVIQLQNSGHPTALLQKANQMRLAGTLCDVVILVDGHEFHAHRTVLACTSKMFEILFHRSSQHYTLDFLSPKTFQQILEYAYTATLQARAEDLDDLLYAAEILEIEYMEEQCLKILETIQASSDDNEGEVAAHDGGEEDGERRARPGRRRRPQEAFGRVGGGQRVQSPSVSTSFSLFSASPTKAAVDSLMSIGHTLLQGGRRGRGPVQPADGQGQDGGRAGGRSLGPGGGGDHPGARRREERGRARDPDAEQRDHERARAALRAGGRRCGEPLGDGPAGKLPPSLYPIGPPNHKSEALLPMPGAVGPPLHVPPALAMSMDFSAYGGLLPQAFIQREFFSKLGSSPPSSSPSPGARTSGAAWTCRRATLWSRAGVERDSVAAFGEKTGFRGPAFSSPPQHRQGPSRLALKS